MEIVKLIEVSNKVSFCNTSFYMFCMNDLFEGGCIRKIILYADDTSLANCANSWKNPFKIVKEDMSKILHGWLKLHVLWVINIITNYITFGYNTSRLPINTLS